MREVVCADRVDEPEAWIWAALQIWGAVRKPPEAIIINAPYYSAWWTGGVVGLGWATEASWGFAGSGWQGRAGQRIENATGGPAGSVGNGGGG